MIIYWACVSSIKLFLKYYICNQSMIYHSINYSEDETIINLSAKLFLCKIISLARIIIRVGWSTSYINFWLDIVSIQISNLCVHEEMIALYKSLYKQNTLLEIDKGNRLRSHPVLLLCWPLAIYFSLEHKKLFFTPQAPSTLILPKILSMEASEGNVQLNIENCLLSLWGISLRPPPGWIMAAKSWMSTMLVNSPGFSRL